MRRNSVTNKKTTIILLMTLISLLIFMWYIKPIEMNKKLFLCTTSGEKKLVKFDISINRHLFAPDTLRGTVEIEGDEYISINSTNMEMEQGTIVERLSKKIKGEQNFQYFILQTATFEESHKFMAQIKFSKAYDKVFLWLIKDEKTKIYYGPAETREEALKIEEGDGI